METGKIIVELIIKSKKKSNSKNSHDKLEEDGQIWDSLLHLTT